MTAFEVVVAQRVGPPAFPNVVRVWRRVLVRRLAAAARVAVGWSKNGSKNAELERRTKDLPKPVRVLTLPKPQPTVRVPHLLTPLFSLCIEVLPESLPSPPPSPTSNSKTSHPSPSIFLTNPFVL